MVNSAVGSNGYVTNSAQGVSSASKGLIKHSVYSIGEQIYIYTVRLIWNKEDLSEGEQLQQIKPVFYKYANSSTLPHFLPRTSFVSVIYSLY